MFSTSSRNAWLGPGYMSQGLGSEHAGTMSLARRVFDFCPAFDNANIKNNREILHMDFSAAVDDPAFLMIVGGHLLVLILAVLFTVMRRFSFGGFFAWVASVVSLLLGLFWFLVLGGGRKNSHADQSVQFALDPQGGLWITFYIVATLLIAYAMTWVCKRGKGQGLASKSPAVPR